MRVSRDENGCWVGTKSIRSGFCAPKHELQTTFFFFGFTAHKQRTQHIGVIGNTRAREQQ